MKKTLTKKEMSTEASEFVSTLLQQKQATVVVLHGDLGSGKTTFVQHVAHVLGVTEHVTSPTFIIQRVYDLERQAFKRLVHIDAYRLESADELEALGWHELLQDSGNLILVEWGEKVADILPEDARHLYFTLVDERTRTISYGKET